MKNSIQIFLGGMYERAHTQNIYKSILNSENHFLSNTHTRRCIIIVFDHDCFRFPNVVRVKSMKIRAYFGLIKKLTVERLNYQITLLHRFFWCVYLCVSVVSNISNFGVNTFYCLIQHILAFYPHVFFFF